MSFRKLPRDSDLAGLSWSPGTCILNKHARNSEASDPGTTLRNRSVSEVVVMFFCWTDLCPFPLALIGCSSETHPANHPLRIWNWDSQNQQHVCAWTSQVRSLAHKFFGFGGWPSPAHYPGPAQAHLPECVPRHWPQQSSGMAPDTPQGCHLGPYFYGLCSLGLTLHGS